MNWVRSETTPKTKHNGFRRKYSACSVSREGSCVLGQNRQEGLLSLIVFKLGNWTIQKSPISSLPLTVHGFSASFTFASSLLCWFSIIHHPYKISSPLYSYNDQLHHMLMNVVCLNETALHSLGDVVWVRVCWLLQEIIEEEDELASNSARALQQSMSQQQYTTNLNPHARSSSGVYPTQPSLSTAPQEVSSYFDSFVLVSAEVLGEILSTQSRLKIVQRTREFMCKSVMPVLFVAFTNNPKCDNATIKNWRLQQDPAQTSWILYWFASSRHSIIAHAMQVKLDWLTDSIQMMLLKKWL